MATPSLMELGLRPFFQQQLTLDEWEAYQLGRVIEQHRSQVVILSENGQLSLPTKAHAEPLCVGDWVLFDDERIHRALDRQSLFQRKAAGSAHSTQLIAANIDTVFILCSLNDDFSLNRIERYLVMAKDAMVEPVIILTKADLCLDTHLYLDQVQALDPLLQIYAINNFDNQDIENIKSYCKKGRTVALLGSSGVGKSTLVNALMDEQVMETGAIREEDSKGRHTTTYRAIKWLASGGLIMDTPGMRELQLANSEEGIKQTFEDIEQLAMNCRFSDCQHQNEPGCAINKALKSGELDPRRLANYQKLLKEDAFNSATLAERRSKDKAFGKMINSVQEASRAQKKFR